MVERRVVTAAEMELMSPNERAEVVARGELGSLDELDLAFRARVENKGRRLLEEHGLLDLGRR
ncbi:MAG: hypothetical protein AAGA99_27200 [Actinomycetota bacterium]